MPRQSVTHPAALCTDCSAPLNLACPCEECKFSTSGRNFCHVCTVTKRVASNSTYFQTLNRQDRANRDRIGL